MKKLFVVILSVLFLGTVSGAVFADTPSMSSTPVAKAKKAKKTHKKKTHKKKTVKASTTPMAK